MSVVVTTNHKNNNNKQQYMKAAIYYKFGEPIQIEYIAKPIAADVAEQISKQNNKNRTTKAINTSDNNVNVDNSNNNSSTDEVVIVVKVMATGVCRSDWHGWKGHDNDIINHGLPFVPGHEASGIVVDIAHVNKQQQQHCNTKTTKLQIGDRVVIPFILSCGECYFCSSRMNKPTVCCNQKQPGFTQYGTFAEYLVIPRAERNVSILPTNVSFVQAAALGCRFTTAYRAVVQQGQFYSNNNTNSTTNQSIAVFGCGGLGLSAIMIANAVSVASQSQSCTPIIIAVDVSKKALQKALTIGATHTVLYDTTNDKNNITDANEQLREQIYTITNGLGVDICIEASGYPNSCENAIWCTRRGGGKMIQVGLFGTTNPIIPMNIIAGREIEIIGSHGFSPSDLPTLLTMVSTGQLDPSILVENEVTLEQGIQALERMDYESPLGITMITKFDDDHYDDVSSQQQQQSRL